MDDIFCTFASMMSFMLDSKLCIFIKSGKASSKRKIQTISQKWKTPNTVLTARQKSIRQ